MRLNLSFRGIIALTLLVAGCGDGEAGSEASGDAGGQTSESPQLSGGGSRGSTLETDGGGAQRADTATAQGLGGNASYSASNVGSSSGLSIEAPVPTGEAVRLSLTVELSGTLWGRPTNPGAGGAGPSGYGGISTTGGTGGFATDPEVNLPIPEIDCGFLDVASADYATKDVVTGAVVSATASSAKLFYSFVPAQQSPRSAPLFVFFNGGPASATMGMLRAFGTGPMSLDVSTSDAEPVPNPNNWATLGNLLYIDARQSGFSYSTIQNATDETAREDEFTGRNFNVYVDAADFVRALLRFFELEPALRNNPVVVVGESYGGIRASLMLSYLLDSPRIAKPGWYFQDAQLAAEIQAHYAQVFPGENPATVTGAAAARQFGHQVLVQPALAYYLQKQDDACNPRYGFRGRLAALGLACPPEQVDHYNVSQPINWSAGLGARSALVLSTPSSYAKLMGVPADELTELTAAGRVGAFRVGNFASEDEVSAWTDHHCVDVSIRRIAGLRSLLRRRERGRQ
ncbi:MAG: hypothetical protein QM784_16235 [Polyangiaceae bacterium]